MTTPAETCTHSDGYSSRKTGLAGPLNISCSMPGMRGLTLIELMVALLITSVILVALVQVFITTRHSYQVDEGLARLQENARFAIQFLTRDLRMAGATGCMGEPDQSKHPRIFQYINPTSPVFNLDASTYKPFFGFDANGPVPGSPYTVSSLYPPTPVSSTTPGLDPAFAPWGAIEGSDVLVLYFQSGDAAPIDPVLSTPTSIAVVPPHGINDGQIVMVSDCDRAFVFQVTGVASAGPVDMLSHTPGGTPGNSCVDWSACPTTALTPRRKSANFGSTPTQLFGPGAQVGQFRIVTYFIGAGGPALAPVPALYRAVFDETGVAGAEELVEGIENMQISYGVDTNGDGVIDNYMTAAQVDDGGFWLSVKTVRIGLLVASSYSSGPAEMGIDTTPFYDIGGMAQIVVPPDNRRRRVVVDTVKIRNRAAGPAL